MRTYVNANGHWHNEPYFLACRARPISGCTKHARGHDIGLENVVVQCVNVDNVCFNETPSYRWPSFYACVMLLLVDTRFQPFHWEIHRIADANLFDKFQPLSRSNVVTIWNISA